jgi:hypothetical protein
MGLLLHIEILEYLQHNKADGGLIDIKPAFEKYLDTMPRRKELKAELEYLLNRELVTSTSRFDFLGWELLTGVYPLEKKNIELSINAKGEAYLQKQTTPRFTLPDAEALSNQEAVYDPLSLKPPETVLPYPKPGENVASPAAHLNPPHLVATEPSLLPEAEAAWPAVEEITPAPQPAPMPVKRTPAPFTPQPMSLREKTNERFHLATEQDTDPVILTARGNKVLNKIAFKAREAKIFAADNSPFAALEVIPLAPNAGKEKKKIDTATILRWAVLIVAAVLAVLLYLIFKKRY